MSFQKGGYGANLSSPDPALSSSLFSKCFRHRQGEKYICQVTSTTEQSAHSSILYQQSHGSSQHWRGCEPSAKITVRNEPDEKSWGQPLGCRFSTIASCKRYEGKRAHSERHESCFLIAAVAGVTEAEHTYKQVLLHHRK